MVGKVFLTGNSRRLHWEIAFVLIVFSGVITEVHNNLDNIKVATFQTAVRLLSVCCERGYLPRLQFRGQAKNSWGICSLEPGSSSSGYRGCAT